MTWFQHLFQKSKLASIFNLYRLEILNINENTPSNTSLSSDNLELYSDKFSIRATVFKNHKLMSIQIDLKFKKTGYIQKKYDVSLYSINEDGRQVFLGHTQVSDSDSYPMHNSTVQAR